jgi:putative membrane protein
MHEPMQNPYPSGDVQAELARERNRIAADRTLLSFIRNSATLISIGFGIDQIMKNLIPDAPFINAWIYILDLELVGLGVMNLWFAAQDYHGEMKRLQQPEYHFTPRWSLGEVTAIILCITSIFIFGRFGIEIVIYAFK